MTQPPDFRAYYEGYDPVLVKSLPSVVRKRYQAMLSTLAAWAPGRTMLEIGCGNGHFLSVAREGGWGVCGTELSRAHVAHARAQGLDVVYGDLVAEPLLRDRRFHAVVAIEVIEHVPDPRRFLSVAAEHLVAGGVLFLTTPNFGSVTRRVLGPGWSVLADEHVALASPKGLAMALRSAGFEVLSLRCKSLYLGDYRRAMLSRGEPAAMSPEEENANLRDHIEGSRVLSAMKSGMNGILDATGLGEAMECLARTSGRRG